MNIPQDLEVCTVYDKNGNNYSAFKSFIEDKLDIINQKILQGGEHRKEIIHGDFGYFQHENNRQLRLFLKTTKDRIEAFRTCHNCNTQGADVNINPGQYFICGNIFGL